MARLAGVSPATVSRVVNNHPNVAPDLVKKVREAIRSLEQGAGLSHQPARRIGVAFPRRLEAYDPDPLGGVFYGQVLSGVDEVLREGGHDLSLFPFDAADSPQELVAEHASRFDGLILMGADSPEEVAREASRRQLPVIVVDKQVRGVDSVVSDNVGGAQEVTAHVLQSGYRNLIYVCETFADPSFALRRAGFDLAVQESGLSDMRVWAVEVGRGWLDAPRILPEIWDQIELPAAVVAGNDMTALQVLALARARGFNVPEQMGIVGFDDVVLASKSDPALTTVRVDKMEMGRLAARRLLERLSMPDLLPITITMHVALMVRDSTRLVQHN